MNKKRVLIYLISIIVGIIIPPFLLGLGLIVYILKFGYLYPHLKKTFRIILWLNILIISFEIYKAIQEVM